MRKYPVLAILIAFAIFSVALVFFAKLTEHQHPCPTPHSESRDTIWKIPWDTTRLHYPVPAPNLLSCAQIGIILDTILKEYSDSMNIVISRNSKKPHCSIDSTDDLDWWMPSMFNPYFALQPILVGDIPDTCDQEDTAFVKHNRNLSKHIMGHLNPEDFFPFHNGFNLDYNGFNLDSTPLYIDYIKSHPYPGMDSCGDGLFNYYGTPVH